MAAYVIPIFVLVLCIVCFVKNINAYSHFATGAK